jgi:VWA domain-containing protein
MVAVLGVSFLTPLDALFVLAGALPVAALVASRRRAGQVRRVLGGAASRPHATIAAGAAVVALTALVAVAAAQPVVVHNRLVNEREDAQIFVLFDTSLSMRAAASPGRPTRLARAKRLAVRLQHALPDVPMGVASMTDRSLPNLLPTTDSTLFARTVRQAIAVDEPPPTQTYPSRATTFAALVPLTESHFYSTNVKRRVLVLLTDGESSQVSPLLTLTLRRRVPTVFVHVWRPGERIFLRNGRPDPKYVSDPGSGPALDRFAARTGAGRALEEGDLGGIVRATRDIVGHAKTQSHVSAYARIPLAPWFVLGGILPLGFLLWRRNL